MRYIGNFALKQILSVIAMLIVVPVLAFGQTNRALKYQKNGDIQSVRQTINDLAAALSRSDIAALDRIYAADYVVTNENGGMTNKTTRLAAIKSGSLKFESVVFSEIDVSVYGKAAVARFRGVSKVQSTGGQPLGGDLRVTTTLVKTKGRWQIVAAHVTRVGE